MRSIDARRALPLASVAGAFACAFSVHHGYVELDENTDPVLRKQAEPNASIASYESRGNAVYVNGSRVTGSGHLSNGDRVHTGPKSWMRIGFRGARKDPCTQGIEIDRLRMGRLFGDTHTCSMLVTTPFGRVVAGGNATEVVLELARGAADVTAVAGDVRVERDDAPGGEIAVPSRHGMRLRQDGFTRPEPLSDDAIRRRMEWISVVVPHLLNDTVEEAKEELAEARLRLGRVRTEDNEDDKTPGEIARQEPRHRERAPPDSSVDVWVWGESDYMDAPDLETMTLEEARTELRGLGLKVGLVTEVNGGTPMDGAKVLEQSPRAYSRVKPGNVFNLKVENPYVIR